MMITPYVATYRRMQKPIGLKRRSFRDISRRYLGSEHKQSMALESLIFAVLAVIAIWPILNAAIVIQSYLL